MRVFDFLNTFIHNVSQLDETPADMLAERFGETTTPNMRALRLSMTVSDYLLSMNVPVSDVVVASLDITRRYCKRKIAVDISSNVLTFSQDRGNNREPLTLIRITNSRPVNSRMIQALEEMTESIHKGEMSLDEAEKHLESLIENPKEYSPWLTNMGNGAISAGVGALLSGSLLIVVITFFTGSFVSYFLSKLAKKRMPAFFIQIVAAASITLFAALIKWLGSNGLAYLDGINPNLIIIGGIVMLVSGMDIAGAVEDAIDEFYLTANARILRVVMMTAGIVAGIILGLYIAKQSGVELSVSMGTQVFHLLSWQYIGAIMISGGYALSVHTRYRGIVLSALMGALSWGVYIISTSYFIPVVSIFFAATVAGIAATMLSRWLRTPSTTLIEAGIIPLVPGLATFNALMVMIVQSSQSVANIDSGAVLLLDAALIALAIAAGASVGILTTRPLRRTLIKAQNALPHRSLRP